MRNFFQIVLLLLFCTSLKAQDKNVFDVARKGTLSEIQDILKRNPEVINAIDDNGTTMLILACYRGNKEVAQFLIKNGADLNYVSKNGTALMACVVKNESLLVDELLKKKINLDLTDANRITALMLAVQFKNVEMVKKLVKAGASKEIKCKQSKTAFEYAVFSNNEEIINLLK